jgi:hypothetical protein
MSLPAPDTQYLDERISQHTVAAERGMICVVLPGFPLPLGFDRNHSDLLLRLNPDVPPDMWWFDPPIKLANGATIPATEVRASALAASAAAASALAKIDPLLLARSGPD